MKIYVITFCLILLVHIVSCIPETRNLKPEGDKAEIKTRTEQIYRGELLTVSQDSVLMFVQSGSKELSRGIYTFSCNNIAHIKIEGYVNYKWQGALLGFEVLPILLLIGVAAASGVDSPGSIAILFVPVFLNYLGFAGSTPSPPGVDDSFSSEQLSELSKYSRFPQGLNKNQLELLMFSLEVEEIRLAW